MGLRRAIARKYAPVLAPQLLRLKGRLPLHPVRVSRPVCPRPGVSRDMTRPVQPVVTCEVAVVLSLPETEDRTSIFTRHVLVSDNLLTPIGTPDRKGKNYAVSSAETLFPEAADSRSSGPRKLRKAYTEKRAPTDAWRQTTSLWDLILPLLKPPLNFDFPAQLDFPSELYKYQPEGVMKLVENTSFLLADEMGTGKTVMASVAMRILFHKGIIHRALVVAPASVLSVWDRHLEDWGGAALTCTVVHGPASVRESDWTHPAHIYITSYDILRNDVMTDSNPLLESAAVKRFDLVVLDEAHYIRNPSSGRSKAIGRFSPSYRWALTGTPLQNKLADLVAIFKFVKPGLFGTEAPEPSRAREIAAPYTLRRRKMDVIDDLPDKVREPCWLDMDPEQSHAYAEALQKGREEFQTGAKPLQRLHIFALLARLRQISNFAPGKQTSPKSQLLLEVLEGIVEEHKAVVFTNCIKEGVDKLRPQLKKYGLVEIIGTTPLAQRTQAIDDFMNDPDIRIFLGSTQAAGEGITLTSGSYVFHFDQWWNPAVAWQAEDRVHRLGQSKSRAVTVYSYWMNGTVEERMHEILKEKGCLFEEVVNGMATSEVESAITMNEWCSILGLEVERQEEPIPTKEDDGHRLGKVYHALSRLSPADFEGVVAEVFSRLGYRTRIVGGAYDGGIDVEASRGALGGKERVVIQCKRKAQVGPSAARELLGTVQEDRRIARGFLVVSGKLSPECRRFIAGCGALSSMEGVELAKHITELGLKLP